jgi:ketosteroid isomerase-like protein
MKYFSAFRDRDYAAMASCYHTEIEFSDPVFPRIQGRQVHAMWHMLVSRGKETKISFEKVWANENEGGADWVAVYPYGPRKRHVRNVVHSQFEFRDGLILRQRDSFDLWKWSAMALGPAGQLLGWSSFMKNKIQGIAARGLDEFLQGHPEYR